MRHHLSLLLMLFLTAPLSFQAAAQITVVNTGSLVSAVADDPKTAVLSFNAGATANKLIVQVSAEGQEVDSITYQGVALTQAAAGTASGRNKGIFYLDNPFTGGAADLSVTLGVGISNGIAIGVVSVSGAAPGVAAAALADGASSVTLTVPVSGSFVVGGYAANGSGTITLPGGHTAIYNSTNIGSANAAASYANAQTVGSKTYTYTDTSPSSPVTSAAVFVPASAAPVITGISPAAGALAVPPDGNLVATFSEAVVAGSGNIELWQSGGTSPLESFNVATSPQITFAGSTLTIDPSANLARQHLLLRLDRFHRGRRYLRRQSVRGNHQSLHVVLLHRQHPAAGAHLLTQGQCLRRGLECQSRGDLQRDHPEGDRQHHHPQGRRHGV